MSFAYESQVYCSCDLCNEQWASQIYTVNEAKEYLRSIGWSIGKNVYCPGCNPKRKKLIQNE